MHTELGSWQRAWRRVGKAEVEVEVDADMVEEKQAEEKEEEDEEEEEEEEEAEDNYPRRRTAVIKSNNPHLAGGELINFHECPIKPTRSIHQYWNHLKDPTW